MRKKPTALLCAVVVAAGAFAAAASAAPIPVAVYTFETQADVDAFSKGFGAKCKKKLSQAAPKKPAKDGEKPAQDEAPAPSGQMAITVGPETNHCTYRSSVVGDAGDTSPDTEVAGTGVLAPSTPRKLQKKGFVAVGTRVSETAGWELRVRPVAKTWQLLRDPSGAAGATVMRSGRGNFIKGIGKPNLMLLRTFDFGSADTQLVAGINGKTVVTLTDSADDQPDGLRNVVVAGAKGTAAGTGITGLFDDVAIRVPNPFG